MGAMSRWHHCFICARGLPRKWVGQKKVTTKGGGDVPQMKPSHNILFKYLLTFCSTTENRDLFNDIQRWFTVGLEVQLEGEQEESEDATTKDFSDILVLPPRLPPLPEKQLQFPRLCMDCERNAERLLALQGELEKVQMQIVERLKVVKKTVTDNSNGEKRRAPVIASNEEDSKQVADVVGRLDSAILENDLRYFNLFLVYQHKEKGLVNVIIPGRERSKSEENEETERRNQRRNFKNEASAISRPNVTGKDKLFTDLQDQPGEESADFEDNSLPDIKNEVDTSSVEEDSDDDDDISDEEDETESESGSSEDETETDPPRKRRRKSQKKGEAGPPPAASSKSIKFNCTLCSIRTSYLCKAEQHLQLHEACSSQEKSHECSHCPQKFSNEQYMKIHERRHIIPRNCDVCKEPVLQVEMEQHIKDKHGDLYPCKFCSLPFGSFQAVVDHARPPRNVPFKCELCMDTVTSQPFIKRMHLVKHLIQVHGCSDLIYKCDYPDCTEEFFTRDNMRRHFNLVHKGGFLCCQCGKTFAQAYILRRHILVTHENQKLIKCNLCSESFSTTSSLQKHQINLHGFLKYKCEKCPNKEFTCQSTLKAHTKTTHEKPVAKLVKCPICQKEFTERNLRTHLKVHTDRKDFRCDICGFATRAKELLKNHMLTHTGEKKYQCNHCQKTFAQSHTLTCHVRTHTGEKPYRCQSCDAAFCQLAPLKSHLRRHHPGEPLHQSWNKTNN